MQEKDNNRQIAMFSQLTNGNQFVLYIFRRISKLYEAIYIITDTVKDSEQLKWKIRGLVAEGMTFNLFTSDHGVLNVLENTLLGIEAVLDFAGRVKVLSDMNVAIVCREIQKVLAEIKENRKNSLFFPQLNPAFFEVHKPSFLPEEMLGDNNASKEVHKSHKGHSVLYDFYNNKSSAPRSSPNPKIETIDKEQRKEEILKIIKDKGSVTIKDITIMIKDCSEKTIQRELTLMVASGMVRKMGERRWSRYSIPD